MKKQADLTTQAAVAEALKKELGDRTEEVLEPIQKIKARLAEIDAAQGRVNAEIQQLQQDLETARGESGSALLAGKSPLPGARKVRELENDIAALQAMPDFNAEESETLRRELETELGIAAEKIKQLTAESKTKKASQADLDEAIARVAAAHQAWIQGEIDFLHGLGIPAPLRNLAFQPQSYPDVRYLEDAINPGVVADRWRAAQAQKAKTSKLAGAAQLIHSL
jgi:hypothetical protein